MSMSPAQALRDGEDFGREVAEASERSAPSAPIPLSDGGASSSGSSHTEDARASVAESGSAAREEAEVEVEGGEGESGAEAEGETEGGAEGEAEAEGESEERQTGEPVSTEGTGAPGERAGAPGAERRAEGGAGEAETPDLSSMDAMALGDLDLVDTELAEHQRWGAAAAQVGEAGSADRAVFVLSQIRDGFMQGAAGGAGMGLTMGLFHRGLATQTTARVAARIAGPMQGMLMRGGGRAAGRLAGSVMGRSGAASAAAARMAGRFGARLGPRIAAQCARFTPLPAIGAVVGGVISFHSLYTRDWRQTGHTISQFGEGGSTYERLANSIAAISEIIDILSNVLNVIAGILGIITIGMWVAAVLSAGALSPLAGTLTAISLAIGAVTMALDAINMIVLQPAVTLFRALHTFTSDADPREVVADGQQLSAAAANNGGAIGGLLGARGSNIGGARPNPHAPDSTRRADDTPPPAGGEGPRVDFEARPQPPDVAAAAPRPAPDAAPRAAADTPPPVADVPVAPVRPPAADAPAAAPRPRAAETPAAAPRAATAEPQQLSLPGMEGAGSGARPPRPAPPPPPPAPPPPRSQLRAITAPLRLEAIKNNRVPRGRQVGSIGTYARRTRRPHPAALLSNPPGAPGATRRGGRMPQRGRTRAGVYYEHQTPASAIHRVLPGHEYTRPGGRRRSGRDVREALVISLPRRMKAAKDRRDAALRRDIDARRARGEDVPVVEVIVRGAENTQAAAREAGVQGQVPGSQISRNFLAEMDQFHDPRHGYQEFRPGDPLPPPPPGHPAELQNLSQQEIDAFVDRTFDPFIEPPPPPRGTQLPLPGMEGMTPRPPAPEQLSLPFPDAPNPNQLALPFDGPGGPGGPPHGGGPPPPGDGGPPGGSQPLFPDLTDAEVGAAMDQRRLGPLVEVSGPRDQLAFRPDVDPANPAAPVRQPWEPDAGGMVMQEYRFPSRRGRPPLDPAGQPQEGPRGDVMTRMRIHSPDPGAPAGSTSATEWTMGIEQRNARMTADGRWFDTRFAVAPDGTRMPIGEFERGPDGAWMRNGTPATPEHAAAMDQWEADMAASHIPLTAPDAGPAGGPAPPGGPPPPAGPPPGVPPTAAAAAAPDVAPTPSAAPSPGPAVTPDVPPAVSAVGAAATQGARAERGASPERSLLTTFLPILASGEHGPSPEEQQASFNAQFAADFPPFQAVERANPAYTDPPCTPAQIEAIRGHIAELRQARAQTSHAERQMEGQVARHEANQGPLAQTTETVEAGATAAEEHTGEVESTAEANSGQQSRQGEVNEAVSHYAEHQGAIDSLRTPTRAFQGMMDLASYLPGDAGEAMADMNRDATNMLTSFDEMDAAMAGQETTGGECQARLEGDAGEIEGANTQAGETHATLSTATTDAGELEARNDAAVSLATERRDSAAEAGSTIDSNIEEQEAEAASLSQQLQTWAQEHRAARTAAVDATATRVSGLSLTVVAVHPEVQRE